MILTEGRMCIVLIRASGSLGRANAERGTIVAIEVPYRSLGSIALVRQKKTLRGVREEAIRCYTNRPPGAIDLEPIARLEPSDDDKPVRVTFAELFNQLVEAACDDALRAVLMEAKERQRLERVRAGERTVEELDIVAEISR
ncbi:hypothetical protein [Micromonospora aurantiaca (nom. illeg.)]|uniref:hypothetical protein n=1 Tax=Micromonospora aurantiaca (nom. illeg.) TaxID=47850 RepID=UPI0036616BD3